MAEELLDQGDSAFIDELRAIHDADKLGNFAPRWYADKRIQARHLLLEYLRRPLNAFRHEALVKRLYKLAEAAGDDEVMAHFAVGFDDSIHRVRKTRHRYEWSTQEAWTEETIRLKRNTLPRNPKQLYFRNPRTGEKIAAPTQEAHDQLRLFSTATRYYLRRRVWRYYRKLAKEQPARYVPAAVMALKLYRDEQLADGLALIDRWTLVHMLFGASPVLKAQANGWQVVSGRNLGELTATPAYETLWQASPAPLVDLMMHAASRPVRQWSIQMLRQHHPAALANLPLAELLELIAHEDAELAQLAADSLRQSKELASLPVESWLKLLETANPQALDVLCELMVQKLNSSALDLEQTVKLACSRPLPVARLGLSWLKDKTPASQEDCEKLLPLAEAESEAIRPAAIAWLRSVLANSPLWEPLWVVDLLDSRHLNVRREAWTWFREDARCRDNVTLWQRLLESPYDDIRLNLLQYLEESAASGAREVSLPRGQLSAELLRLMWASVLLNVHRGNRAKPFAVRQVVERLAQRPSEAEQLLPILSVALRSVRGPEWRAGLAGLVRLVETSPQMRPAVEQMFPELSVS
jgi:hypothetical protein